MMTLSRRKSGIGHTIVVSFTTLFLSSTGGAQPPEPSYPYPLYPQDAPHPPYPEYPQAPPYPPYPDYPEYPQNPAFPQYPEGFSYPPLNTAPLPTKVTTEAGKGWAWGGRVGTTLVGETNATTFLCSPQIDVAYRLSPTWNLFGTWGLGGLIDSEGLFAASLRMGNPFFAVGYGQNKLTWAWSATLGLTLPIVRIPSDPEGRLYTFLVNQNLAMNGMWNAWFWLRDFMAFPAQGSLTLPLTHSIPMTLVGAMAPLWGVRKQRKDIDLIAQISVAVDLPAYKHIDVGPRLQLVFLPDSSVDRLQSAAALRISYTATKGRYYMEVLLNLDEPLGMIRGLRRWGFWFGKEWAQ